MNLSWIKIGSRFAILVILYLLLSIPNSKYQYFSKATLQEVPYSFISDNLVTNHLPSILTFTDAKKTIQYDSLVSLLSNKLVDLSSARIDINSHIINIMSHNFGLASALVSISSNDAQPLLENLWQWRKYLKEQSLFWGISTGDQKLRIAGAISFIGICEDFIVANKALIYTKNKNAPISFDTTSVLSNIVSGDFLLSADDISYSYLERAKYFYGLTPSLGLVLLKDDSSFYITTSPIKGLHVIKFNEIIVKSFSRRQVLRLRADLPELVANAAIPHQAANFIYELAAMRNIEYDFSVDLMKRTSLCETGLLKFAYEGQNLNLITSFCPLNNEFTYGLKRLGIDNDNPATASELQYHPSLEVVGQQLSGVGIRIRNLEMASASAGLANIDAKLMKSLRWRLPYYRFLKGYGHLSNIMGNTPVIPRGMAPETAIIHDYIRTQNKKHLPLLVSSVAQFEKENKYFPTYTMLYEMAKANLATQENM